jgi:hypothetical protein
MEVMGEKRLTTTIDVSCEALLLGFGFLLSDKRVKTASRRVASPRNAVAGFREAASVYADPAWARRATSETLRPRGSSYPASAATKEILKARVIREL